MGSTAINPNFTQQGSRPLPIFFGYALASGDTMIPFVTQDGSTLQFVALGDGENDGIEQAAYGPTGFLSSTQLTPSILTPAVNAILPRVGVQFHSGQWTPIGLPSSPVSVGSDQGIDTQFSALPTITPPQSFSNICYLTLIAPDSSGALSRFGFKPTTPLQFYGIIRGTRCRYFDVDGNVTGYGFTTNPVWHRVEMLLRYKIKKQQPQIAGLTDAEKARFNWPSIVALATRNDFVLANGSPRFMGNYVFASNATLTSMLETSCRCDRSYIDDQDGKIGFFGHDYAAPSFALTGAHIEAGSWKCEKKDLTDSPNVFVPNFRDLNIQALVPVEFAVVTNAGGYGDGFQFLTSGVWGGFFNTGGQNPFPGSAVFYYGDGSNPLLNHDYVTAGPPSVPDTAPGILTWAPGDLSVTPQTGTGGYIGTQTSRFGQRSPNTVQHSRHQAATAAVAPGIAPLANVKPVTYDLGNMTYDQANRVMQWQMNYTLGMNVPGWIAPQTGSVTVIPGSVDAAGNLFDRLRPGETLGTFSIDDTVSPENVAQGFTTFVITKFTPFPPSKSKPLGAIEIEFATALPAEAYPDTSYAPDASLRTIASASLSQLGKSLQRTNVAWTIQATPAFSGSSLTIPDLTLQVLGDVGFRTYPSAVWTGLPTSGSFYLWVSDPDPGVTTPTFGFSSAIPSSPAATNYPVYAGGESRMWP